MRPITWARELLVDLVDRVRLFGVVTVLALFGLCLALLDNHFDDVQAARRVGRAERAVDSVTALLTNGLCVWVAGPRDTTKGHDTVPVRYQGPRR